MKNFLFALLGLVFFCSCEKDDNNVDKKSSTVNFMSVGNKWVYDLYSEGEADTTTLTYKILSDEGNGYFSIESFLDVLESNDMYWYYKDGVFAENSGAVPPNYVFALIDENPALSDKWTSGEEDETLGTITRQITSMNETITVPAGIFANCLKIKETYSEDSKVVSYYWFSYDAGIVKESANVWYDVNETQRVYFNMTYLLRSKNF